MQLDRRYWNIHLIAQTCHLVSFIFLDPLKKLLEAIVVMTTKQWKSLCSNSYANVQRVVFLKVNPMGKVCFWVRRASRKIVYIFKLSLIKPEFVKKTIMFIFDTLVQEILVSHSFSLHHT